MCKFAIKKNHFSHFLHIPNVASKNDNEGNFKINFCVENRKECKFLHKKVLVGSFFEFFLQFLQSLF
jgi:hypothetical protein